MVLSRPQAAPDPDNIHPTPLSTGGDKPCLAPDRSMIIALNQLVRASVSACIVAVVLAGSHHACAAVFDKKWHFPIGVAYASGLSDLSDAMEAAAPVRVTTWPVGLHLDPYYSLDDRLGFGGSIGPVFLLTGDLDGVIVPVGLDLRFNFAPKRNLSPHVRVGVRQPFASGDLFGNTKVGIFGAAGLGFNRDRDFAWGAEVCVDTSEVEVTHLDGSHFSSAKPYKVMLSLTLEF